MLPERDDEQARILGRHEGVAPGGRQGEVREGGEGSRLLRGRTGTVVPQRSEGREREVGV